jgi:chromosome segregation ATPase
MALIDVALAPLRAMLGSAEREAESVLPVRDLEEIESRVLETAESIKAATESIESHVAVVETLATSVTPLTDAVVELTRQLAQLNTVLAPLAGAERDVSRIEHLFGRRHHAEPDTPAE